MMGHIHTWHIQTCPQGQACRMDVLLPYHPEMLQPAEMWRAGGCVVGWGKQGV